MGLSASLKLMTMPRIRNHFDDSLNIHKVKSKEVKISLLQAMEAHRFARG
jgi:hypothetical protein